MVEVLHRAGGLVVALLLQTLDLQAGLVALVVDAGEDEDVEDQQGAADGDGDAEGSGVGGVPCGFQAGQRVRRVRHVRVGVALQIVRTCYYLNYLCVIVNHE